MAKTPNRKRRAAKVLGADAPDPLLDAEARGMTDDELWREYGRERSGEAEVDRELARAAKADPLLGYVRGLTDEQLLALHAEAEAELHAAAAELEARTPTPEPVPALLPVPEPPEEIHAVTLQARVQAIVDEPDPKKRRALAQNAAMLEAIRVAQEDGAREAARDWELERRMPSTYDGPSLDALLRGGGR